MVFQKYSTLLDMDIIFGLMRDEIGDWDIEDDAGVVFNDQQWTGYSCIYWTSSNFGLMWKTTDNEPTELILNARDEKELKKGKRILGRLNFEDKVWYIRKILETASDSKRKKEFEIWFNLRIITLGILSTCIALLLRFVGIDQTWLLTSLASITSGILWGMFKYGSMKDAIDIQFLATYSAILLAFYIYPVSLLCYLSLNWITTFLMEIDLVIAGLGILLPTLLLGLFTFIANKAVLSYLENKWALIRNNVLDSTMKHKNELPLIEGKLSKLAIMKWIPALFISWLIATMFAIFVIVEIIFAGSYYYYLVLYPVILVLGYFLTLRESFSVGRVAAARHISGYPHNSLHMKLDTVLVPVSPRWINRAESLNLIEEAGDT